MKPVLDPRDDLERLSGGSPVGSGPRLCKPFTGDCYGTAAARDQSLRINPHQLRGEVVKLKARDYLIKSRGQSDWPPCGSRGQSCLFVQPASSRQNFQNDATQPTTSYQFSTPIRPQN